MSVRISTPRMTTEPSIRLWEERIFGLINSLTGLLTVLMAPRPSRELPPPQVPANWAVLRILAQSPFRFRDPRPPGRPVIWECSQASVLHWLRSSLDSMRSKQRYASVSIMSLAVRQVGARLRYGWQEHPQLSF